MKPIFRKILLVFGLLVLLIVIAVPIYISYWRSSSTINTYHTFIEPNTISYSDMKWQDGNLGDEVVNRIALFVPVKIAGLTGNLFMQFDTGAQRSVLYGKTLDQVLVTEDAIDTYYDEDNRRYFKNPTIQLNAVTLEAEKIRIAKTLGTEKIDSSFVIIGTIGFDALVNRTLILDFKNDKLAITETGAEELEYQLDYVTDASVDRFPLLIPAKIGGKNTRLFYDTGSSMFSLITSNKRVESVNSNAMDSLCCITNWGNEFPVYRKKLDNPIMIGDSEFSGQSVYGCEVVDMVNYIPSWYLYGLTGNRLFNDKIVVIDAKNNLFGIED